MSSRDDHTTLFRQSWSLYDAIAAENYMFHRELYARVAELLKKRSEKGPYSILDLGCGNARFLAPCLQSSPPESYTGVDLSSVALEEAEEYLKDVPRVSLRNQDMLEEVAEAEAVYDLIFTGYAVHHLSPDAKQQLFHSCASRLAPGGEIIMVDVLRGEGQSRESYLQEYIGIMNDQWTAVKREYIEEACAHVAAHDFPETFTNLVRMAETAGLLRIQLLAHFSQHHLIVFGS
ncbi:MAG: class I SAM-dependent methyltransferase [Verrucomicrobiales bacterium]